MRVDGDRPSSLVVTALFAAKTRVRKNSLASGPNNVALGINSSLQPRSAISSRQFRPRGTYSIGKVLRELCARERPVPTKGVVHGEQREIDAYQPGGKLEKAQDVLCRYFLRPLVGLGDVHRGSDEWPPHACSTRKGALFGTCRIIFDVSDISLRHNFLGRF